MQVKSTEQEEKIQTLEEGPASLSFFPWFAGGVELTEERIWIHLRGPKPATGKHLHNVEKNSGNLQTHETRKWSIFHISLLPHPYKQKNKQYSFDFKLHICNLIENVH